MKVGTDGVLLGAWAQGGRRILDVGTGTGVIALMMAQRYREALVTAIDIDEDAVLQARQNVAASPFQSRVEVVHSSIQDFIPLTSLYDSIVSNPPFFTDALRAPDQQRNVARHTDALSYRELMDAAWRLMSDDGELSVVIPFDYRKRLEDEAIIRGFFPSRVCAVKTTERKPARRYLLAFRKQPCPCERIEMTIGDSHYRAMTSAFYL